MLLFRLLQLVCLFFLVSFLLQTLFRPRARRGRSPAPEKTAQGEEMVQDPQCGTYVPLSLAVVKVINGGKVHFCSEECRDAYKAPR
jgi:YHS domain-containing protein